MTRDDVIAAFNAIRVWQNGDRRAVHKPLLVLLALSRVNDVASQTMDWNEAEPLLKSLLEEFGPDGSEKIGITRSGICRRMDFGSWMALLKL